MNALRLWPPSNVRPVVFILPLPVATTLGPTWSSVMMTLASAERPQKSAVRMQLIHTALRFIFSSQVLTLVNSGTHFLNCLDYRVD
jgi:hypothetical protein